MDYVYHGSKVKGLKTIEKRSSTHQLEYVYATYLKTIAIIFISNGGNDLYYDLSGRGTREKPLFQPKRKAGMFDEIFNLSGSLYILKADNFQSGKTNWSAEVVSEQDEIVVKEEYIENVLKKLVNLHELGELQLFRYPKRPEFIPLDNSDLIPKIINWHNKGFKGIVDKFVSMYPELEDKLYEQVNKQ